MKTKIYRLRNGRTSTEALGSAVRALRRGELVVFPTETVYGIAADPNRASAIRKIRRLKDRPSMRAMALQVASSHQAARLVQPNRDFNRLARTFWPGPLTLVARPKKGRGKIGIRVPRHTFSLRLLKSFKKPLVVTSLNATGRAELWQRADILRFVKGKVDTVFLEPKRARGKSSTVCDISGGEPRILRKGAIQRREILNAVRK